MARINPEVSSGDIRKIVGSIMAAVGEKYKFKVSIKRYAEFDAVVIDVFEVPRGHKLDSDEIKAKVRAAAGCTVTVSYTPPKGSDFAYVG